MHYFKRLKSQPLRTSLLALGTLALFALLLLWRPVLRGEVFLPVDALLHLHPWRYSYERVVVNNPTSTDPIKQVYPRRVLANEMLKQGKLPLWNPSVLTGYPMLADGQLALFFPSSVLFLIVPLFYAYGLYAYLHVILAGFGTWLFARRLALGRGASLFAATCYMFNGYLLTWLQFPHHTGATAMLPWCFWAVERAVQEQRWRSWALAGFVLGLPVLSHFQLAFYIYIGVGCYALARLLAANAWPERRRIALGFSAAIAIALALSAVQLLPAAALASQGQRTDLGFAPGSADAQFTNLLRTVLPLLGGAPKDPAAVGWGPRLQQVPMPYTGLAALLLAVIALLLSRHRQSSFFGLLAVGSFSLAVSSPLLQLFMWLVPPYRQFEDHLRWFVLWGFAVAILAGMGIQALSRAQLAHPSRRALIFNRALLAAVALFLAVWGLRYIQLFTPESKYGIYITLIRQQQLGIALALGLAALLAVAALCIRRVPRTLSMGALIGVLLIDLLWNGGTYNTSVSRDIVQPTDDLKQALAAYPNHDDSLIYPPTSQMAFLQSQPGPFRILGGDYLALPPNLNSTFGIEDIRGYVSLYSARYNRLARLIDGKDYRQTGEGDISFRAYFTSAYEQRRLLNMLNVEYIIFPPGSPNADLYAPLELVLRDDEGTIYRNPEVLPRAWLVHQAEVLPDDIAQLDRLAQAEFNPATSVILDSAPPALAHATAEEPTPSVSYSPNRVDIQASVNAPAILVLADAYDEDWRVTVDGAPAQLYRANYALRGVYLPSGEHSITFEYRPRALLFGGVLSLVTSVGLLICAVWSLRQRARAASSA